MEKETKSDPSDLLTRALKESLEKSRRYKLDYSLEKKSNQDEIKVFSSESWECVDGRYEVDKKLRYPGGHLGLFMTFLSASSKADPRNFNPKYLANFFARKTGAFRFHTDDHHIGDQLPFSGCGHLNFEFSNPQEYEIDKSWLENLDYSNADFIKPPVVLLGQHNESALVIVRGTDELILPASRTDEYSVFVYHPDVSEEFLKKIALEAIKEEYLCVDLGEFTRELKKAQRTHLRNTAENLVYSKGLPVFIWQNGVLDRLSY